MTTEPTAKLTRYRHKKRGTTYEVIGRGILQATEPPIEGDQMVAYKSVETGDIWFRPETEFEDGRFEELPALASLTPPSDADVGKMKRAIMLAIQFEQPFGKRTSDGGWKTTVGLIKDMENIASIAARAAIKAYQEKL